MADGTQIQSPVNPPMTVTGAPPQAPVQNPNQLVKMWAPGQTDGEPGDVYAEKVHDAVLAGGTIAVPFVAPTGEKGYVALHKVPDAIKAGGHIDNGVINALSDNSGATGVGAGFAEHIAGTMRGAADIMGGQGTAERVGLPPTSTPSTLPEKIGAGAASVLEFMLGEEGLKGLSLGEKLEKIAPAIKAMESHPSLAKVVSGALRGATVGGTQGAVTAEGEGKDVLTGAGEGAVFGAAGGAVGEIPAAIAASKTAQAGAESGPGLVSSVLHGKEAAEPMANRAMRLVSPWAKQADANKSLMTQLQPSIDNVLADAKANYKALDDTAGTNVKELYQDLEFAEDKIRQSPDGSAEEARWEADRQKTLDQIEDAKTAIVDKMGQNGLKLLGKADSLFKRAQALKDVQAKVFQNPSVVSGDIEHGTPETVNVDAAIDALKRLKFNTKYGASRLEQALGKQGATSLMDDLYAAQRAGQTALTKQRVVKAVGLALGLSGLAQHYGAAAYHAVRGLMGSPTE